MIREFSKPFQLSGPFPLPIKAEPQNFSPTQSERATPCKHMPAASMRTLPHTSAHSVQEGSPGPLDSRLTRTKLISGAAWFDTMRAWLQARRTSDVQRNASDSKPPFAQGWLTQGKS